MAKKEGYKISDMYQGEYSSLDPESYSPTGIYTGFKLPARQLGAPTKADTANQIAQVNMLLNLGIIPIEVGALNPDVFDAIPREHFKEINRMAKLAGADISVHAPLIEASGVTEQGWDESSRNKQSMEKLSWDQKLKWQGSRPRYRVVRRKNQLSLHWHPGTWDWYRLLKSRTA